MHIAVKDCPASYLPPIEPDPDKPDKRVPHICARIADENHGISHIGIDGTTEWIDTQPGAYTDWHDRYTLDSVENDPNVVSDVDDATAVITELSA